MQIHPLAIVDKKAEIGSDVTIGPYSIIEGNVKIGNGVRIGPDVVVYKYTSIGDNCVVHAHAVLGDLPQDTAYRDCVSFVRVGSGTTIREGVTIHRGTKPDTVTEVGAGCFLMANSHLAHNVRLGNNVVLANGALLAGYVDVGERAFISGNAVVHQFVRIGRLAMLGGNCGISQDVLPFCTMRSVALNETAGLNVVGMRRAGFKPEERLVVKRAFSVLFRSGLNMTQAVAKLKQQDQSPLAIELCDFIAGSKRGICGFKAASEPEDS